MSGFWYLLDIILEIEISKEVCHKNWNTNTFRDTEAIVLLELLEVLERKGQYINYRMVKISFDNRINYKKLVNETMKVSIYVQDTGAEIA